VRAFRRVLRHFKFGGVIVNAAPREMAEWTLCGCGFHPKRQGGPHESIGVSRRYCVVSLRVSAEIMHDGPSIEN